MSMSYGDYVFNNQYEDHFSKSRQLGILWSLPLLMTSLPDGLFALYTILFVFKNITMHIFYEKRFVIFVSVALIWPRSCFILAN